MKVPILIVFSCLYHYQVWSKHTLSGLWHLQIYLLSIYLQHRDWAWRPLYKQFMSGYWSHVKIIFALIVIPKIQSYTQSVHVMRAEVSWHVQTCHESPALVACANFWHYLISTFHIIATHGCTGVGLWAYIPFPQCIPCPTDEADTRDNSPLPPIYLLYQVILDDVTMRFDRMGMRFKA